MRRDIVPIALGISFMLFSGSAAQDRDTPDDGEDREKSEDRKGQDDGDKDDKEKEKHKKKHLTPAQRADIERRLYGPDRVARNAAAREAIDFAADLGEEFFWALADHPFATQDEIEEASAYAAEALAQVSTTRSLPVLRRLVQTEPKVLRDDPEKPGTKIAVHPYQHHAGIRYGSLVIGAAAEALAASVKGPPRARAKALAQVLAGDPATTEAAWKEFRPKEDDTVAEYPGMWWTGAVKYQLELIGAKGVWGVVDALGEEKDSQRRRMLGALLCNVYTSKDVDPKVRRDPQVRRAAIETVRSVLHGSPPDGEATVLGVIGDLALSELEPELVAFVAAADKKSVREGGFVWSAAYYLGKLGTDSALDFLAAQPSILWPGVSTFPKRMIPRYLSLLESEPATTFRFGELFVQLANIARVTPGVSLLIDVKRLEAVLARAKDALAKMPPTPDEIEWDRLLAEGKEPEKFVSSVPRPERVELVGNVRDLETDIAEIKTIQAKQTTPPPAGDKDERTENHGGRDEKEKGHD